MQPTPKQRNMTSVFLLSGGKVLLLYREKSRVVSNLWIAAAGGHMEQEELGDAERCVLRELQEELGLQPDQLENFALRYITLRHTAGEIRVNYFFFADLPGGEENLLKSEEGQLGWFTAEEAPYEKMALSAAQVLRHYFEAGREEKGIFAGITARDGAHFHLL